LITSLFSQLKRLSHPSTQLDESGPSRPEQQHYRRALKEASYNCKTAVSVLRDTPIQRTTCLCRCSPRRAHCHSSNSCINLPHCAAR
jgi:hypothetical protein